MLWRQDGEINKRGGEAGKVRIRTPQTAAVPKSRASSERLRRDISVTAHEIRHAIKYPAFISADQINNNNRIWLPQDLSEPETEVT